jgi:PKD repeat protein
LVINSTFSASATYSDIDTPETLTANWIWEDGTNTTQSLAGTSGMASASHIYTLPGVYNVQLVITDSAGALVAKLFRYAVIYDPNAGFVTGGGWINSQAGWCTLRASCAVASKAELGYQAKYKKNSTIPTGEIEFEAKGLHLHSTSIEWLVISGITSQVKGQGTIEGVAAPNGSFIFQVWSTDGSPDTFRLRIWWEDVAGVEHTVYDTNGVNQILGGGNIKIHK